MCELNARFGPAAASFFFFLQARPRFEDAVWAWSTAPAFSLSLAGRPPFAPRKSISDLVVA